MYKMNMSIELAIEIAMDRLMSDLCLKYYLETNEKVKQDIYDNEIVPLYKKINNI
tara:strand:- start:67 stop:231 length:165 start_codon:yes stop_codon:yes gene_type:complete